MSVLDDIILVFFAILPYACALVVVLVIGSLIVWASS